MTFASSRNLMVMVQTGTPRYREEKVIDQILVPLPEGDLARSYLCQKRYECSIIHEIQSDCIEESCVRVCSSLVGGRALFIVGQAPRQMKTMPPNPAVEPPATNRSVVPMLMLDSITPSRWLHPHPARRRSRSGPVRSFPTGDCGSLFR